VQVERNIAQARRVQMVNRKNNGFRKNRRKALLTI